MESGLPDDVLSDEPVMPVVPIKPNKTIPLMIGICLIIGGLLIGLSSVSNFMTQPMDNQQAGEIADGLNAQGSNLSAEDITGFFDDLEEANYFTILGVIELIASITLLIAGILMVMKNPQSIKIGFAGAGLVIFDAGVSLFILNSIESPDPLLSMSMNLAAGFWLACGLFCLGLPAIPLLVKSGRAALN
ncbi:MAG: hypothetical protein H8D82_02155 [Euryarchaeota archaeon]|nr:hypothetical protein [Euryarchaeota archaeon]